MNITGLGSASWLTSQRSLTSTIGSGSTQPAASDTTTFSASAFAALLAEQRDGPPPLSDEMAADIGSALKEDNAELFAALDSDEDGSLSADELKAGIEALRGTQGRPSGPPPGPPPELDDEQAAEIGATLAEENAELFSALDADGDGVLSADELQAGMDSLRPSKPSQESAARRQEDYRSNLIATLLRELGTSDSA